MVKWEATCRAGWWETEWRGIILSFLFSANIFAHSPNFLRLTAHIYYLFTILTVHIHNRKWPISVFNLNASVCWNVPHAHINFLGNYFKHYSVSVRFFQFSLNHLPKFQVNPSFPHLYTEYSHWCRCPQLMFHATDTRWWWWQSFTHRGKALWIIFCFRRNVSKYCEIICLSYHPPWLINFHHSL